MRHPFIRTLAGQKDPYFKNTTLLLHGDGTNGGQNNTFVDGSTNNFTITRNGNTTQGTFSPYGDNWSNYFDGNGDWLSLPASSAYDFGTGDFTIEAWFYLTGNASANSGGVRDAAIFAVSTTSIAICLVIIGNTTTTGTAIQLFKSTGSTVNLFRNVTIAQNTWHHVAVTKQSGSVKFFLNGEQQGGSDSDSNTWGSSSATAKVGSLQITGFLDYFPGYISGLRVLKGTAQYTANFTPPTAPLTAITNTSLLTCQSNRFRDASTNNFTITRNGDVSVQRFSPFSPTAAYAAETIGRSGYFDGTGDNLSIASANGLCNFAANEAYTFQVWVYRLSTLEMVFIGSGSSFQVGVTGSGGGVRFGRQYIGDIFFGAGSVPVGAWSHITICRNTAGATRCWTNGVSAASTTDTGAFGLATTRIGSQPEGTFHTNGYLSDMRILKGQALYDPTSSANIEVPTAPLSAITNTSFLLNFTNAAIIDNTMMNVVETSGTAQISTSIKKYGTGSIYCNGGSNWLKIPNNKGFEFGTGDFTIECWFYRTVTATNAAGIIGFWDNGGWLMSQGDANRSNLRFGFNDTVNSGFIEGGGGLVNDTWQHLAITRSGTTLRLFVDGVLKHTASNSTNLPGNSTLIIGAATNGGFGGGFPSVGYLDDVRITKGVARYTANFIPPTAPFPDF